MKRNRHAPYPLTQRQKGALRHRRWVWEVVVSVAITVAVVGLVLAYAAWKVGR